MSIRGHVENFKSMYVLVVALHALLNVESRRTPIITGGWDVDAVAAGALLREDPLQLLRLAVGCVMRANM